MSDGSSIEWCDATWQPTIGCSRVDHRCDNCYAINFVNRGMHETHRGLTKVRPKGSKRPGPDWNGVVRFLPQRLADPLSWKQPRRVFVDSMSDLFHPSIPFETIAAVHGVISATQRHTYLIPTKRPERAREFAAWLRAADPHKAEYCRILAQKAGVPRGFDRGASDQWPLPNVHLGVSVSDQPTADKDIPVLLECDAALYWISVEPQLDVVRLSDEWLPERAELGFVGPDLRAKGYTEDPVVLHRGPKLGWIVIGGESGPGARPFHVDWARVLVEQCRGLVPTFVKQLGAFPFSNGGAGWQHRVGDSLERPKRWWSFDEERDGDTFVYRMSDRKGKTMADWPEDLRIRELPR